MEQQPAGRISTRHRHSAAWMLVSTVQAGVMGARPTGHRHACVVMAPNREKDMAWRKDGPFLGAGQRAHRKVMSAIQSSPLVKPLKEMTAPVADSVGASTTFPKYCSRASPPAATCLVLVL